MLKLKRDKAGFYNLTHGDNEYQIFRWYGEVNPRVPLWCVNMNGTALDDFRTLSLARDFLAGYLIGIKL